MLGTGTTELGKVGAVGRKLQWLPRGSQQNACGLTGKQDRVWVRFIWFPLARRLTLFPADMVAFPAVLVLRPHRSFRPELCGNQGITFYPSTFRYHVEEAKDKRVLQSLSGNAVFSSAIPSVVHHPEASVTGIGSCLLGTCGCEVSNAPMRLLAGILVFPVENPSCILLF